MPDTLCACPHQSSVLRKQSFKQPPPPFEWRMDGSSEVKANIRDWIVGTAGMILAGDRHESGSREDQGRIPGDASADDFFFIALHIVALIRVLMLKGTGIAPMTSVAVTIGALVLGKSVLLADMLPMINRFPEKPLIYNVSWKTIIYLVVAAVVHYLERLVDFWRAAGGFVAGNEKLLSEMVWPHFWAIQIVLFVLILMYCTMHELVRLIGADRFRRMFFGPMPTAPA